MPGCEIPKTIFVFYPQFQLQGRTGKSRSGMLFKRLLSKFIEPHPGSANLTLLREYKKN